MDKDNNNIEYTNTKDVNANSTRVTTSPTVKKKVKSKRVSNKDNESIDNEKKLETTEIIDSIEVQNVDTISTSNNVKKDSQKKPTKRKRIVSKKKESKSDENITSKNDKSDKKITNKSDEIDKDTISKSNKRDVALTSNSTKNTKKETSKKDTVDKHTSLNTKNSVRNTKKVTQKYTDTSNTISTTDGENTSNDNSVVNTDTFFSFLPASDKEDKTVTSNNILEEKTINNKKAIKEENQIENIHKDALGEKDFELKKHPIVTLLKEGERVKQKQRTTFLMNIKQFLKTIFLFNLFRKKQKKSDMKNENIARQFQSDEVKDRVNVQQNAKMIEPSAKTSSIQNVKQEQVKKETTSISDDKTIFTQESLEQYNESHIMHTLHVQELHKYFGKKKAVQGVSFSVNTGEVVGFLGPNGAGKTTVFYMIVGFIIPTKGSIVLDGNVINKLAMHKRAKLGISYLPQDPSVFRRMSVEKNILAILETIPGLKRKERKERLETILRDFGLLFLRKQKAYTLSGGERRRTEIARAMALKPRFLLLDEPFTGIDPKARYELKQIIAALAKRGVGVLITDHNEYDTLSITNRAFIIHNGKIVVTGSREEIMNDVRAREIYLGEHYGT